MGRGFLGFMSRKNFYSKLHSFVDSDHSFYVNFTREQNLFSAMLAVAVLDLGTTVSKRREDRWNAIKWFKQGFEDLKNKVYQEYKPDWQHIAFSTVAIELDLDALNLKFLKESVYEAEKYRSGLQKVRQKIKTKRQDRRKRSRKSS